MGTKRHQHQCVICGIYFECICSGGTSFCYSCQFEIETREMGVRPLTDADHEILRLLAAARKAKENV